MHESEFQSPQRRIVSPLHIWVPTVVQVDVHDARQAPARHVVPELHGTGGTHSVHESPSVLPHACTAFPLHTWVPGGHSS